MVWSLASNPTSSLDEEPYGKVISGSSVSTLYIVGYDCNTTEGDDQWPIEKRNPSNGSLVESFGTTTGVVVSNPSGTTINSWDDAYAIAVVSTAMYVVGLDSVVSDTDWEWRIEKRDLVTGASVTAFGTDGAVSENLSAFEDAAYAVAVDSRPTGTQLYMVGYEETTQGPEWRIEAENALSDAVRFFHLDALSSAVGLKVDFDMTLLVLASGLYRLLAQRMRGYADAQARQIFRDLINLPATITVSDKEVEVSFHRRSHLPILLASGLLNQPVQVPWWDGHTLRLTTYTGPAKPVKS